MQPSSGLRFTATVGSLPSDTFAVYEFACREALSSLFCIDLVLFSADPAIAAETLLEQPVELIVWQDGALIRRFHGVVSGYARGSSGFRRTRYELTVEPSVWRLSLAHNCRIFQNQSSAQIARLLLEERGIANPLIRLQQEAGNREYCVQYRESDLEFIERLAAEEGWHYRFETGDYGHRLVIEDEHFQASELPILEFNGRAGGSSRQASAWTFSFHERVRVAATTLKDYTFRRPDYSLLHHHEATGLTQRDDYEHYDYPGRYKADASGRQFTRARLDSLRQDASEGQGQSNRADLMAGARVSLEGHDLEACNRDWLITAVEHTGRQPQALEEEAGSDPTTYSNRFQAVPGDRHWRPALNPEHRPIMDGPQIAIVTGPAGEEIYCDEFGRVKVRFPWDRYSTNDESSSAWLRVSQSWAGSQYGAMMLPRIGHEVIVSFLDGDPDQPIITGRTYHAANRPPYELPAHKTRTVLRTQTHKGDGFNELSFEDEHDQERVFLRAQKDLNVRVENNRTETIGGDSHCSVGGNTFSRVGGSVHQSIDGELREQIGGDLSLDIGGSVHSRQGDSQLIEAGHEIHHKAGLKVVIEAGAELTLSAGGSFIKLDASGVSLSGPQVKLNSGGSPGTGSAASVLKPEMPGEVDAGGNQHSATELAETGQRRNAEADAPFLSRFSQPEKTAQLLSDAAQSGSLEVQACEFDQQGRCVLHDHH